MYADSNGVWHRAEDIVGGTFGTDEGTPKFYFLNNVGIGTTTATSNLTVNGSTQSSIFIDYENSSYYLDSDKISKIFTLNSQTLSNTGKITTNELTSTTGVTSTKFIDLDNLSYEIDPSFESSFNQLRANGISTYISRADIYRDITGTSNFLNLNGFSNINSLQTTSLVTGPITSGSISATTISGTSILLNGQNIDLRFVNEGQGNSILSGMIVDGTITASDLGANSVGTSELASNAVTSAKVKDNSLTASDLGANSVGTSELVNNAITSAKVLDNSLTASDLGANSVGTSELVNNAVTSAKVLDNSLTASDLGANSVGASEIAEAKSGDYYGRGVEIADDGVMEIGRYIDFHDADADTSNYDSRISANGATLSISGDLSVLGGDLNIGDAKFYRDSANRIATPGSFYVRSSSPGTYLYSTNTYLGASSGDAIHIRGNVFDGNNFRILNGDVYARNFYNDGQNIDLRYVNEGQENSILTGMIVDGTITDADLGANSVRTTELASNAVNSAKVLDNSLTASDLGANSVGASELVGSYESGSAYNSKFMGVDTDGHDGLKDSTGSTSNWIRTTTKGIIPKTSGGASSLGTPGWPFTSVHAKDFYDDGEVLATRTYVDSKNTNSPIFNTVDTGQGSNELYAMNQDVQSSDSPTFNDLTVNGVVTVGGKIYSGGKEVLTSLPPVLDIFIVKDTCSWSGYLNSAGGALSHECSNQGVISGLDSNYNIGDRRWRVRCCTLKVVSNNEPAPAFCEYSGSNRAIGYRKSEGGWSSCSATCGPTSSGNIYGTKGRTYSSCDSSGSYSTKSESKSCSTYCHSGGDN
jgi:hypothetical protein